MKTHSLRRWSVVLVVASCALAPTADAKSRPDLVVSKLTTKPTALSPGELLSIADVTVNRGKSSAPKSVTAFFLSRDTRLSRDDIRLGQVAVGKLRPGRKAAAGPRLKVPASATPGSYRLLACADARGKVKEPNERNNCRASSAIRVAIRIDDGIPTVSDSDGDGTPNASDCAPTDPSVHPGATDLPDLGSVDANCDGIDGIATNAIFAAPSGSDSAPGTQAAPKRSLNAAVAAAVSAGLHQVYAAAGPYPGRLVLSDGVSIYGGYAANWSRPASSPTVISNSETAGGRIEGAFASGLKSATTLQRLSIAAADASAPGVSVYAVRAVDSPGLVLEGVTLSAGSTAPGSAGTTPAGQGAGGGAGGIGQPGVENSTFPCSSGAQPQGGPGGSSPVGRPGAKGGTPGLGIAPGQNGDSAVPDGGAGGLGVAYHLLYTSANVGQDGAAGADGANGAGGAFSFGPTLSTTDGGPGTGGSAGHGGGGGGGGGGGSTDCDSYGSSGGGGGGGAAGGQAGSGGSSAGGSFALYLWASNATITGSSLSTGTGGAGGAGAAGSPGGTGGPAGPGGPYGGSSEQDDGTNGAPGGRGGDGGDGGAGGGGAGGPSIGILEAGGSSPSLSGNTITIGQGGAGGASPGNAGASGTAAAIHGA
jgi:hypothetical protein